MIKTIRKLAVVIAAAGLMAASLACTAFAAEERTPISSVRFKVESDLIAGEDNGSVSITLDSEASSTAHIINSDKECDWEFTNGDGEWKIGDQPAIEITLCAKDGYYFKSMSSSNIKLTGSKATYVSSKRQDKNETLVVKIKLEALGGAYQLEEIEWVGDDTAVASWVDPEDAGAYQVKLYRNGKSAGTAVTTNKTEYDFSNMITKEGDYTFKVRTYINSKKHGEYEESGDLEVTEENINLVKTSGNNFNNNTNNSSQSGTYSNYWFKDAQGNWKIRDRAGNTITNCWVCDDAIAANGLNVWYLIGSDGNMITSGLVRDVKGYYYSIETNHNGYYGMLRYKSGTYDGVNLTMNPNHDGSFGALSYESANALYQKYGSYTDISYIPTTCKYTSQF